MFRRIAMLAVATFAVTAPAVLASWTPPATAAQASHGGPQTRIDYTSLQPAGQGDQREVCYCVVSKWAGVFPVDHPGFLKAIQLNLTNSFAPYGGDAVVEIHQKDSTGAPGALLSSATVPIAQLPQTPAYYTFTLSPTRFVRTGQLMVVLSVQLPDSAGTTGFFDFFATDAPSQWEYVYTTGTWQPNSGVNEQVQVATLMSA